MNCWEILGIEPTGDHQRIREAYNQQMKFASKEEAERLEQAFREATGEQAAPDPSVSDNAVSNLEPSGDPAPVGLEESSEHRALSATEEQVVREVIIQVKALLNDHRRAQDPGVWKAIVCEPPADQAALRREVAQRLESQLRPLAENGNFPIPVTRFIGDWFGWFSLAETAEQQSSQQEDETEQEVEQAGQPRHTSNFWPAVIGWIIVLVVLTSLFGGLGGGG
ncbi:J domain-containing protein [Marinobacter sp. F4216]|uniref:J domain-containing protein n=1 Tax=Marinobacter sp. F4216 TaxID=2874281 RepID=UPI001CBA77C5|nr:J domain-containing protein [Marinobacter sp. F4216]MBZ2168165.1 J domain-containing protein [Marinobacter sp. F4216]